MEKQLYQPSVARVTLENDMDYTDLIERLNNLVILDEVRSDNRLGKEAADAIEALVTERGAFRSREAALIASNAEVERDLAAMTKEWDDLLGPNPVEQMLREELTALRAAIEAAEKVEPVGRINEYGNFCDLQEPLLPPFEPGTLLYIHPPSAKIEELRRDAARYQWLKKHKFRWNGHCWHSQFGDVLRHTDIDAAIDSAMQEKQP